MLTNLALRANGNHETGVGKTFGVPCLVGRLMVSPVEHHGGERKRGECGRCVCGK